MNNFVKRRKKILLVDFYEQMTWNVHMWCDIDAVGKLNDSSSTVIHKKSHQIIILLYIIGSALGVLGSLFHLFSPLLSVIIHISLFYFIQLLYVKCLAFSGAHARFPSSFLCSSVRKVVLKSKWMMIIKSPICLMALCYSFCQHTHTKVFVATVAGSKRILYTYQTYITFYCCFFFAFWFFYWIFRCVYVCVCVHCVAGWERTVIRFRFANRLRIVILLTTTFVGWPAPLFRVQVFMMRKSKMKNVFNVQTVEPNKEHTSSYFECVYFHEIKTKKHLLEWRWNCCLKKNIYIQTDP